MPGKILEMKPLFADAANQQETPKQISKSDALKGYRETKPGSQKKEEVTSVLEEQIKKVEEILDSKEDFAIVPKSDDDAKDPLKELTGGVNVIVSSKAKNRFEALMATLSDDLSNSSPKTKALIYKPELAPVVANLFQLISVRSEDSEEMLKPLQSSARTLLEEAVRYGSGSNNIEFSDLNSVLSILGGNSTESVQGTINLINSQGLDKLIKSDSGFISKLSRSSGKLGKSLAQFVQNKVLALTTRHISLLGGDSDIDPETIKALETLKEDIFNKVETKLQEDLEKKSKSIEKALGSEGREFIDEFLAKIKAAYLTKSDEPEAVETNSREIGKLILQKHSRIRVEEAKVTEAKNKTNELTTAISRSGGDNPRTVRISKDLIGDNSALKEAWYKDLVANAKLALTKLDDAVEISQKDVVEKLKVASDKTNKGSVSVSINDLLKGLAIEDLNEEQIKIVSGAINSKGVIDKKATWGTTGSGKSKTTIVVKTADGKTEVKPHEVLQAILDKITETKTAEADTNRKRATEIVGIDDSSDTTEVKLAKVLEKQPAWDLVVDKDRKDIANNLKKQLDETSKEAKQKAKDYKKFMEEVNRLVLVPMMSKASTISKTILHGLKESMTDEDGNIKDEFSEMFTDYAKAAKDEIEALANQAGDEVESAKLTALSKVKKALTEAIGKFVPGADKKEKDVASALGLGKATTKENYDALIALVNNAAISEKTKITFSENEKSLLDPSKDGTNDFDKANNQFKRLILISKKLLALQQAQKNKTFDKIADSGLKSQLTDLLSSDFGKKVSKDLESFLSNKQSGISGDVNNIENLEKKVEKYNDLRNAANDDIWDLATGDHEHKSLVSKILENLQKGVKEGVRAVLRATGLYHEDNVKILQERVDKMKEEQDSDDSSGMPKILKATLTGLMKAPETATTTAA